MGVALYPGDRFHCGAKQPILANKINKKDPELQNPFYMVGYLKIWVVLSPFMGHDCHLQSTCIVGRDCHIWWP